MAEKSTGFGDVNKAFLSLSKKTHAALSNKGWICKQGIFRFVYFNTWKKWTWEMTPFFTQTNPETSEALAKIYQNLHLYQQEGFCSRKQVVAYVEALAGKNTKTGFVFDKLCSPKQTTYVLQNSSFFLFKQDGTWVVISYCSSNRYQYDDNQKPFKTRKQALQFLFDKNMID